MALYPDYADAAAYKAWVYIDDTDDDTQIGVAVTSASRAIDHYCNRQFGLADTPAARYFTPETSCFTKVFDLQTTTGLVVKVDADRDNVYETTLTIGTHFRLTPRSAAADGVPWTGLEILNGSAHHLPLHSGSVEVTARWGWTAVPDSVVQACLFQADVLMKRRQQGLGQDYTAASRYLDRDVQQILRPFRRWWAVAA